MVTQAILAYTAAATGGLSASALKAAMGAVQLYDAPPADASFLPANTSDAVFDVLFGANIVSDDHGVISGSSVTRTLTLGLTAPSFVSLGNADPTGVVATTNNPPYPAAVTPSVSHPAPPDSLWIGCIVSSSPADVGVILNIHYTDYVGNAGVDSVVMDGRTPVNLTAPQKYRVTAVTITSGTPRGQINLWSGPIDEVTGFPTGIVVGYLPCSYFTNFSFKQLTGWTALQVTDPTQAYALVPPDYNTPNETVIATPPPSLSLLNYPPPSSVASPNPGSTPNSLLTPVANFTNPNPYLSAVAGATIVPNPFQGLGLGAFAQALNMPMARAPTAGSVSMTVSFA